MTEDQQWELYSEAEIEDWYMHGFLGEGHYLKTVCAPSSPEGPKLFVGLFAFCESKLKGFLSDKGIQMPEFYYFDFVLLTLGQDLPVT